MSEKFSPEEMGRISGISAKNREFDINSDVFADCVKVLAQPSADINTGRSEITDDELLGLFKAKSKK